MSDEQEADIPLVRPFLSSGRDRSADYVADSETMVRAFLLTNGRAEGRVTLAYEAMITVTAHGSRVVDQLRFEARTICDLCARQPQAIAELAAHMRIPIGSVRVIAADLVADGVLDVHHGVSALSTDTALLKRLILGVRAL